MKKGVEPDDIGNFVNKKSSIFELNYGHIKINLLS